MASSASRAAPGHPQSQISHGGRLPPQGPIHLFLLLNSFLPATTTQAAFGFTQHPGFLIPTPSKPWRISTGRFMPSTGSLTSNFPNITPSDASLYTAGCVEVVGCVRSEELVCWEDVPESVRLERLTDFCGLCENPQKLGVPFEMRGFQGVYNLERRIYDGAVRGLSPVQGPLPVKFSLPHPRDPFSLKPGSLKFDSSKSAVQKTPSVTAAIAGARAAAGQYSRKDHNAATSSSSGIGMQEQSRANHVDSGSGSGSLSPIFQGSPAYLQNQNQPSILGSTPAYSQNPNTEPRTSPRLQSGASNRWH